MDVIVRMADKLQAKWSDIVASYLSSRAYAKLYFVKQSDAI